jgi:hypothetical protein
MKRRMAILPGDIGIPGRSTKNRMFAKARTSMLTQLALKLT